MVEQMEEIEKRKMVANLIDRKYSQAKKESLDQVIYMLCLVCTNRGPKCMKTYFCPEVRAQTKEFANFKMYLKSLEN